MGEFSEKFWRLFGLGIDEPERQEDAVETQQPVQYVQYEAPPPQNSAPRNNVVPMPPRVAAAPPPAVTVVSHNPSGASNNPPPSPAPSYSPSPSQGYSQSYSVSEAVSNTPPVLRSQVVVFTPQKLGDLPNLVSHLREGRLVVASFEGAGETEMRSWLNFIYGAACALSCTAEMISGSIYLIAPQNVDVTSNLKEILLARDTQERGRETKLSGQDT